MMLLESQAEMESKIDPTSILPHALSGQTTYLIETSRSVSNSFADVFYLMVQVDSNTV